MVGPDANTWLQAVKESRSSFLRLKLGYRKDSGFLKNWRKACDSLLCSWIRAWLSTSVRKGAPFLYLAGVGMKWAPVSQ